MRKYFVQEINAKFPGAPASALHHLTEVEGEAVDDGEALVPAVGEYPGQVIALLAEFQA